MELPIKHLTKSNIAAAGIAGLSCFAIAFGINAFAAQQRLDALELEQVRQDAQTFRIQDQLAEHVHTWVPYTTTIHHNAVTTEVQHQPIYDSRTTYHTVCNECEAIIDGNAQAHIADTGHVGYSTNVPISTEVLRQAGYTEIVVLEDAWDETVTDGAICSSCGEKAPSAATAASGASGTSGGTSASAGTAGGSKNSGSKTLG